MSDLSECRLTGTNKPFRFSDLDYVGSLLVSRRTQLSQGLVSAVLVFVYEMFHVELVTSLDVNSFLLAFFRFTNLRRAVDTIYSDNSSTVCAAADGLPKLFGSTEFQNLLQKNKINWIKIPPYAPSEGESWEIIVKLIISALNKTLGNSYHTPNLIKLQTFVVDAVRIVNEKPLTSMSDQSNNLSTITPSSL